jgi:hypothetical protein
MPATVLKVRSSGHAFCWRPSTIRNGATSTPVALGRGSVHCPGSEPQYGRLAATLLEYWLGEQTQRRDWPFKVQVYWLPKNASWLDQIEIWFSILQRRLLKPNDFGSLRAFVRNTGSFVRYHNRTAKPIYWTYTIEKLDPKPSAHY